jgi:Domain of unknown function (DUF4390)
MLQRLQMLVRNLLVLAFIVALAGPAAHAQSVDLPTLGVERRDGSLQLEFVARVQLSRAVEDALSRGVPVYFAAQATLYRNRWYWRDERVARVGRTWRLAYQPLTSNWRVGVGAITQTFPTLAEALSVITRTSGWKLTELSNMDADARHYVEFSFRLDTSQLPSPMLIGLTSQAEWQLAVERTLKVE